MDIRGGGIYNIGDHSLKRAEGVKRMTQGSGPELSLNVKDFHFFLPVRVHYADTDAQQVVYYGSFSRYFEAGRQEYWRRLGIKLMGLREASGAYLSIVAYTCRFFQPCFYDDVLDIYVRTPDLRRSSFDLDYLVMRRKEEVMAAVARTTFVFVDKDTWKSTPMPDGFRTAIEQFEKQG